MTTNPGQASTAGQLDAMQPERFALNPDGRHLPAVLWIEHRWPFAIWIVHVTTAFALTTAHALDIPRIRWDENLIGHLVMHSFYWVSALIILDLFRRRHLVAIQRRYLTARTVIGLLLVSIFISQESQVHEGFKRNIGRASNPFRWDVSLQRADAWLHFGQPPWRWLDPLFHSTGMTAALDLAYWAWFPLVLAAGCWLAVLPNRRLRARALLAWALVWLLLGTGVAQLLPSAGPVYYHYVVAGPDPYAPLLAHLDSVNAGTGLIAVRLQQALWSNFQAIPIRPWLHVSAMPSMHVAIPALFSLVLFKFWRPAGVAAWAFTAVIFCGSIYLGWHYALDGYVSVFGVLLIWAVSDRLLGAVELLPATQSSAAERRCW